MPPYQMSIFILDRSAVPEIFSQDFYQFEGQVQHFVQMNEPDTIVGEYLSIKLNIIFESSWLVAFV